MQLQSGGKFLSAKTCNTGDILTFKNGGVMVESNYKQGATFPDGKPNPNAGKPQMQLQFDVEVNGVDFIFTCGKTNQKALAAAYGRNTDDWIGKKCGITIVKVMVGGEMKDSVMLTPTKSLLGGELKDEWKE
jgi:hypothetical protein